MPKKRKAQEARPLVDEGSKRGRSKAQVNKNGDAAFLDSKDCETAQVKDIVETCKEQVVCKVGSLIETARQRAQFVRANATAAINNIPKQVRIMSAVDFFGLTPNEAASSTLHNFVARLKALLLESNDSKGEGIGRVIATKLAACAATAACMNAQQLTDGAGTSSQVPDEQPLQEASRNAQQQTQAKNPHKQATQKQPQSYDGHTKMAKPKQTQAEQQERNQRETEKQTQQQGQCSTASAQVSTGNASKLLSAAALMPPPPPRVPLGTANPPVRQALANEAFYSANGSPTHIDQFAPVTSAKGMAPSMPDVTPAAGTSIVVAPPTLAFTGQTFRRAAPTRGRVKQPIRSITVTTSDGKRFTVDDLIGLAGVPQAYRSEVWRLVEADMQDLNAIVQSMVDLEQKNSDTKATCIPAGPSRPKRT